MPRYMLTCKEPTAALSNPYCIFAIDTTQQMRRHLRLVHSEVSLIVIDAGMLRRINRLPSLVLGTM
jgi:hypothetical protein